MKSYCVDVDITMSRRIYVNAENEEQAKTKVGNLLGDDPYYYAKTANAYVCHEITDCYEDEDEED